jgi:signal transduction histidine kinase
MTVGTSPRPRWTMSGAQGTFAARVERAKAVARAVRPNHRIDMAQMAKGAAALYLAGLGVMVMTAWTTPGTAGGIGGPPGLHLAFLLAMGGAAALLSLAGQQTGEAKATRHTRPSRVQPRDSLRDLMAQMSHELRTPLNAVIGFSDVMLRELHGPLGHARYQEYAHHISESGGRLLKTSEDALAVTEAMSALLCDATPVRRERVLAVDLIGGAWTPVAGQAAGQVRLSVTVCQNHAISCEARATGQALEHLLREAVLRAPTGTPIEVHASRCGIEIRTQPHTTKPDPAGPGSLPVFLARLLLETQGATLACTRTADGAWSAVIAFASSH